MSWPRPGRASHRQACRYATSADNTTPPANRTTVDTSTAAHHLYLYNEGQGQWPTQAKPDRRTLRQAGNVRGASATPFRDRSGCFRNTHKLKRRMSWGVARSGHGHCESQVPSKPGTGRGRPPRKYKTTVWDRGGGTVGPVNDGTPNPALGPHVVCSVIVGSGTMALFNGTPNPALGPHEVCSVIVGSGLRTRHLVHT